MLKVKSLDRSFLELFSIDLDVAEYLLNNLCCLPFQNNFTRPKNITLIQIWFFLKKDRMDLEIANEQSKILITIDFYILRCFLVNLSTNLSNLILNNSYSDIAQMLNRRTLNNNQLLDRIFEEYNFKIPGKFPNQKKRKDI